MAAAVPDASGGGPLARFLRLVPALVAAELVLGAWSLAAGLPAGGQAVAETARLATSALGSGTLALLRVLPLLFLLSWPWLRLRDPRLRLVVLGVLWSVPLLLQVALDQFYLVARVPLGAELFGYSWAEVRTTVAAGAGIDTITAIGWLLPLAVLWTGLIVLARRPPLAHRRPIAVAVIAASLCAWWWQLQPAPEQWPDESGYTLALNKSGYFVTENIAWLSRHAATAADGDSAAPPSTPPSATLASDARYPFLRPDRTPDALGPYFTVTPGQAPPNLVFVIVEGLGRSFSGPEAALGSFTPFLDQLAERSLYWDNFLANQGRTFGVLPSLFGSLPFGERGFAELGEAMPAHAGLLSVLGRQGYQLGFYSGWDADFDNERLYLQRQGVSRIIDIHDYGPAYPRSPGSNSWGYADRELVARVLADAPARAGGPSLTVLQTITMHTPYTFPGQAAYRARLEQRLDALDIAEIDRAPYRQYANIYTSILYTDDALRAYFDAAAHAPGYANTIFIVTGDHRLPELPLGDRIERYHVPLLVYSPMLRRPARIRSVSSHLDVAPSLLALLSHQFGIRRPARATWVGSGLDMEPTFRNVHDIPLKQSKTLLPDFVSGTWFLNRGTVYALTDGMRIEPTTDAAAIAGINAHFAAFRWANDRFTRSTALSPEGDSPPLVAYDGARTSALPGAVDAPVLAVREVHAPRQSAAGVVHIDARFSNDGGQPSAMFVPLVVILAEDGHEVGERSCPALSLAAGAQRTVRLTVDLVGLPPGRYHLAIVPTDPGDGHRVGVGRYRIPLSIRG